MNDHPTMLSAEEISDEEDRLDSIIEHKKFADLIDKFKILHPAHYQFFKNKTQRSALQRLVDRLGHDRISNIIEIASQANGQLYAPSITSPCELERKLGQLAVFFKKQQSKKNNVVL